MESLARLLIGFVLIYQLSPIADCKVIRQRDEHEAAIKETEVNYERSNTTTHFNATLERGPQVELTETSIKYTNATPSSSGSSINSLTHIPEEDLLDDGRRSFSKLKKSLHGVKRSFKKIFFAWTYYGPEVGLCSCLFKYAWFTYPVVPEMTHTMMGRARRMVNGFVHDFWRGYADEKEKEQYRISNKVADMTADDYYEYKSNQIHSNYGPFRRVDKFAGNRPENVPIIQKSNPQLVNVVEMLKNLQPKANLTDFVVRLARHIKSQPRKPHNAQQFRYVSDDGDEIRYYSKLHRHDEKKAVGNATKPAISTSEAEGVTVEGRSSVGSNILPFATPNVDRISQKYGPPEGLPSFNELPPADYSYYKDGVHHHVHDLRKEKGTYPIKGGGWLKIDFEEAILSALGLTQGRSAKPSIVKCSKVYAFQAVLRFFQTAFLG